MWTACQTLIPRADIYENGWKAIFPSPISLNSEQFYSHHLLRLKIIIPMFHICIGQGPNTWGKQGASTTDNSTEKTIPSPHMMYNTVHNGPCKEVEFGVMCSVKNKKVRTKFWHLQHNFGSCTSPCFKHCHKKLHFLRLSNISVEYAEHGNVTNTASVTVLS
jgi:hypothetical protein